MDKKLLLGSIGIVVVGALAAFFFLPEAPIELEEQITTPTQWSQAGDYNIIEGTSGGTLVVNEKAGFSFVVPEGWSMDGSNFEGQYVMVFTNSIAVLKEGAFLESGCSFSIETRHNKSFVNSTIGIIEELSRNPGFGFDEREVFLLSGHEGVKEILLSQDPVNFRNIYIEVPLNHDALLVLDFTERAIEINVCKLDFDIILNSFIID
jgi:hypothetical protein